MGDKNRKRNKKIQFYLSEKEYINFVQIERKSGEINRREFVINSINNAEERGVFEAKKITVPDDLSEAVFQMKQVGNNINQIAYFLNREKRIDIVNVDELNNALRVVSSFKDIANRIKNNLDKDE
jgi:hypothetical protein